MAKHRPISDSFQRIYHQNIAKQWNLNIYITHLIPRECEITIVDDKFDGIIVQ